jgi:cobaltochelatase CobT
MKSILDVKRSGLTHNINETKRAFGILARMLTDKGVKVVFKGTMCATDHQTIYLPELSLLDRADMTEQDVQAAQSFLEATRGFIFHEVGHILFTDQKVFEGGAKESPLIKHAMNCVEDVRIEKRMAEVWRGSSTSLQFMNEWMLRKMAAEPTPTMVSKVLVGVAWVSRVGKDHWFYEKMDTETKALLKQFAPEMHAARNIESTEEALRLGRRIVKKLEALTKGAGDEQSTGGKVPGAGKGPGPGEGSQGTGADSGTEEPAEEPEEDDTGGEGSQGTGADSSTEEPAEEPEEDDTGGDEADDNSEGPDPVDVPAEALKKELEAPDLEEALDKVLDKGRLLSSELKLGTSAKYLVYTTEFDSVVPAPASSLATYTRMMAEARQHFGVMKRNLANMLKARANAMTITELEEGDLDSSLLYRLAAGRSDRVFKEEVEHFDTNVGVVLLVNESGSMASGAMNLARVTAALFGEVLDALGIQFACYGHTTGENAQEVFSKADVLSQATFIRWGATQIRVYKDFDESFAATKTRIPTMQARANTHDAEALIYSGNQLILQKGLNRRIIMTIDDGAPHPNVAYAPVACSPEVLTNMRSMLPRHQEYVREVVGKLEAQHVEVLGLGMGTDSVRNFYKKWLVVSDVASFPVVALRELRRLLLADPSKVKSH